MIKDIFINLENEVLTGNVLDIGFDNKGIIYNLFKKYNENAIVEYRNGEEEKEFIQLANYDSCITMFTFKNIRFKISKLKIVQEIHSYLKEGGILYIWDIDKGYKKIFRGRVKILLPDRKIKEFKILDANVFKDNSKECIIKLINPFFEVLDLKHSDEIYFIKARKKGIKKE